MRRSPWVITDDAHGDAGVVIGDDDHPPRAVQEVERRAPGTLAKAFPELPAMLRRLEWTDPEDDHESVCFCPVCGGMRHVGHRGGCSLLAAIIKAEGSNQ